VISQQFQGFSAWFLFSRQGIEGARNKAGVYVIRTRAGALFGRLKGKSDIVYIGNGSQLRQRPEQHLTSREDERDVGYLLKRVENEVGPLELSWKECSDRGSAKLEEARILREHAEQHIELPPLNRQETGKRLQRARHLWNALSPDQQKQVREQLKSRAGVKPGEVS
jgi:hypothetical protein